MFWKKKDKKKKEDNKPSREELIAKAKANAKVARESIGEETLDKIRDAMMKKEQSALEQAKAKIKAEDKEKVANHLSDILNERD